MDLNQPNTEPSRYTTGTYTTEQESCEELDHLLASLGLFKVYREVRGFYLQPRLGQLDKTPRIDRVLVPTNRLLTLGWPYGPIGIECKRSGEKLGPPIAQLLDYSRAAWQIRPGFWIILQWVFLWPLNQIGGPIESILAQQRLGRAWKTWGGGLALASGQTLARFTADGEVTIGAGANGAGLNGRKAGSR